MTPPLTALVRELDSLYEKADRRSAWEATRGDYVAQLVCRPYIIAIQPVGDEPNATFRFIAALVNAWPQIRAALQPPGAGAVREAIIAMAEDGWLYHGVEGMSEAQEKCLAAYLLIKPPAPAISDKQGGAT